MSDSKKVTIIGGGTGTSVVTQALKHQNYELTKIVTVFDSGGSTARLRDEFGFLPIGDLRQSLAALAQDNGKSWIRELLLYRFTKGEGLEGHNLGNLILTALQDMTGSTPKALEVATKIFRIKGQVLPITTDHADLEVEYEDGTISIGEHLLDESDKGGRTIKNIKTTAKCKIYDKSRDEIVNSDYIIIGPGDLYGSLMPNFIVDGAKEAVMSSKAKIIYIVNLMTRYSQTHGFTALDHINTITKYAGRSPDIVIINNEKISKDIETIYAKHKEYPVVDDLPNDSAYQIIRESLASSVAVAQQPGDAVARSLMRHDQEKLTKTLLSIIK